MTFEQIAEGGELVSHEVSEERVFLAEGTASIRPCSGSLPGISRNHRGQCGCPGIVTRKVVGNKVSDKGMPVCVGFTLSKKKQEDFE